MEQAMTPRVKGIFLKKIEQKRKQGVSEAKIEKWRKAWFYAGRVIQSK